MSLSGSGPSDNPLSLRTDFHPAKASPIERLPLELKFRIASFLGTSGSGSSNDVKSLARASRSFQAAAEPIIWRKVDLSLPRLWDRHPRLWNIKTDGEDSASSSSTQPFGMLLTHGGFNGKSPDESHVKSRRFDWHNPHDLLKRKDTIESIVEAVKSTEPEQSAWNNMSCDAFRQCKLYTRLKQVRQAVNARSERLSCIREVIFETPEAIEPCRKEDELPTVLEEQDLLWQASYLKEYHDFLRDFIRNVGPQLIVVRVDPIWDNLAIGEAARNRTLLYDGPASFSRLQQLDIPWPTRMNALDPVTTVLMWTRSEHIIHLDLRPPWPLLPVEIEPTIKQDTQACSSLQHTSGGEDDRDGEGEVEGDPSRFLSRLRTLSFHQLDPRGLSNISSIFKHVEKVEDVYFDLRIENHMGYQALFRVINNDQLRALSELESLRRLTWLGGREARWIFEKISTKGFAHVQVLTLSQAIECEGETYIDNIYIPPFPSLKYIHIPCRSPKWYKRTISPEWAKAPPPQNAISAPVIRHLRAAPNLLGVQFGVVRPSSSYDTEPGFAHPTAQGDDDILDSEQWYNRRMNGVLIRSYMNPVTGEELYHFRRMELLKVDTRFYVPNADISSIVSPDSNQPTASSNSTSSTQAQATPSSSTSSTEKEEETTTKKRKATKRQKTQKKQMTTEKRALAPTPNYERGKYRWVDHTSFKGAAVSPPVLARIYKLKGEKPDWKTCPGRGLELPEQAWEVLYKWRKKLPDKGEIEAEGERRIVTRNMRAGVEPDSDGDETDTDLERW
ncbi:hypothetical protein I317_03218 [Kwoniella heveanensis CBS 569]|nr:hypothetical protein I317_03218 [Kwoniella heveanensis CBS 569]